MLDNVRAAVAHRPKQPLDIETLSLDNLFPGEVLVEMKAAGICHTDLTLFDGSRAWTDYPLVLGHEGAGVVAETGPGVTSVRAGDHVILGAIPECGECPACRSTRLTNLCDTFFKPYPRRPFSLDGRPVRAFVELGTFSSHAVVRETQVCKIRSDAPLDVVCCMGCAGATGLGAAAFTAQVTPGSTVVVFGLGGIGTNVIDGARICGATRIIGVDTNPAKEKTARIAGLTDFVNPKDIAGDLVGHLREITKGGADYAFECVGSAQLWTQAVECTRIGWGTAVMVGIPPSSHETIAFRTRSILEGRRIMGCYIGNVKTRSQLPELVDWYMDGRLSLDQLVSARIPLEQINEGFAELKAGNVLRSVVQF
jgi:S-(hydroxymethyl)glutathione dehydrogenase/alcohol dehydrogenase